MFDKYELLDTLKYIWP